LIFSTRCRFGTWQEINFQMKWFFGSRRDCFFRRLVTLESQAPKVSVFEGFVRVGYGIWIIITRYGDSETRIVTMRLRRVLTCGVSEYRSIEKRLCSPKYHVKMDKNRHFRYFDTMDTMVPVSKYRQFLDVIPPKN
jgi:hypothetical protein